MCAFRFRDLYGWEEKREFAIQTFNANKNGYMHVAVQGLEKDMKLNQKEKKLKTTVNCMLINGP